MHQERCVLHYCPGDIDLIGRNSGTRCTEAIKRLSRVPPSHSFYTSSHHRALGENITKHNSGPKSPSGSLSEHHTIEARESSNDVMHTVALENASQAGPTLESPVCGLSPEKRPTTPNNPLTDKASRAAT